MICKLMTTFIELQMYHTTDRVCNCTDSVRSQRRSLPQAGISRAGSLYRFGTARTWPQLKQNTRVLCTNYDIDG